MQAGDQDCIVIVAGAGEKQAGCAVQQVLLRAKKALDKNPVPEETRKMLESGSTAYMRPLPGAARMYPETDVLPVMIDQKRWDAAEMVELLTEKNKRNAARLVDDYKFKNNYAEQVASSEYFPRFEKAIAKRVSPDLAASSITRYYPELKRERVDVSKLFIKDEDIAILCVVEKGQAAKEAIPDLFKSVITGSSIQDAIAKLAPAVSREDLEGIVKKIIADRADFVMQKGKAALGPLMGVVMEEVRGSVDGKVVSELLKREIDRVLAGKSR
jgi:glutamyl-tRNA(Gln) amidotransferase subunit E